jgi:hypothetical protein
MAQALKTPIPEHVYLGKFFDGYPSHCETTPSSWVVWNDTASKEFILRACHAELQLLKPEWTDMITAVPFSDENSLEYLRMLIRGPFRSLSDLIRLERIDKNYALLLSDLNRWPANVLMNFCIASRVPIEFKTFLPPWAELCEKGYDPTLAFLIVYSRGYKVYRYSGEDKNPASTILPRSFDVDRGGHMWVDPSSSWSNVLNGNIVKPSQAFTVAPSEVCPTNVIWGTSDDWKVIQNLTDEQVVEFFTSRIEVLIPPPMWVPPPKKKKAFAIPPAGFAPALQPHNPFVLDPALLQWHNAMQHHILHDGPDPGPPPGQPVPGHGIHDEIVVQHNAQGAWGMAQPDEPQPQPIGMINEVEEEDGFPDDWDADPVIED